jgi:hypothetical protein
LCCGLVFLIGKFSGGFGVRCSTFWNSFRIGVVRLRFGLWRKVGSGVAGARGGFFCVRAGVLADRRGLTAVRFASVWRPRTRSIATCYFGK